ncbi:hypothetical protein MKS88_000791 [Plasmodium brasilianum]|uniref:Uncharacterized protein n=1 Tax=Plasmodium brasilianum TaxID=5824 RepID=A0ACB9YH37_PLABR|nr:hypothetical protein MKS88_000791 [Plasmodium brasilianum]
MIWYENIIEGYFPYTYCSFWICDNIFFRKNISNNERETKGKKKKSDRISLNKVLYYTEVTAYDNGMRIRDIALKKIKFRSYKFGVTLYLYFLLLGIGLPTFFGSKFTEDTSGLEQYQIITQLIKKIKHLTGLSEGNTFLVFFSIVMLILSIIHIIALYKILRNNEKYKKINLITE